MALSPVVPKVDADVHGREGLHAEQKSQGGHFGDGQPLAVIDVAVIVLDQHNVEGCFLFRQQDQIDKRWPMEVLSEELPKFWSRGGIESSHEEELQKLAGEAILSPVLADDSEDGVR
jgi:hypothetical protein